MRDSREAPGARGNYSGAVDAYLELTSRVTKDQRALENAWDAAVRVAVGNVPGKARTVVQEVAARLRGIGRDDRAEELLGSAGVDARSGGAPAYQAGARKPARPGSAQPKRDIVGFNDAAKESRDAKENGDASPAAAEEAARREATGTSRTSWRGLWDPTSPRRIPSSTPPWS